MSISLQSMLGAVAVDKPIVDLRGLWIGMVLLNNLSDRSHL
jgi:methane/ammonia monooxygenase subunit C